MEREKTEPTERAHQRASKDGQPGHRPIFTPSSTPRLTDTQTETRGEKKTGGNRTKRNTSDLSLGVMKTERCCHSKRARSFSPIFQCLQHFKYVDHTEPAVGYASFCQTSRSPICYLSRIYHLNVRMGSNYLTLGTSKPAFI